MNPVNPDSNKAIQNYRRLARRYDDSCRRVMSIRQDAVGLLGLRSGDYVLDVACGTGLSFPMLVAGVGLKGKVVGLELSPDMAGQARKRIVLNRWDNVSIIEADAGKVEQLGETFDSMLFHYTHDVLRQPDALFRILSHAKPGARIVLAGIKAAPWWLGPIGPISKWRARQYLTTYEGFENPWSNLLKYVPEFHWSSRLAGTNYVGWGPFDHATFLAGEKL